MNGNGDWTFVPAELDEVLSSKGHNALLGHRYNAHSPEWLELAMPWQAGLVGDRDGGAFAAGPIMALLDNATGVSIWLKRGGYLPQVTLDLRVDHLRPPQRGAALICRCECYKLTPKLGYSRGFAYETSLDDPVAHVAATYMLL